MASKSLLGTMAVLATSAALFAGCATGDAGADDPPTAANDLTEASPAGAGATPAGTSDVGPAIDSPEKFQDLNGVMWLYTTENDLKFTAIQAKLDDYKARGIRVVGIYSPYHGNRDKWEGCAPLDYYATSPQSGTIDDFRALVKAAHQRGMKIVTYFVSIYIDKASAFFVKAQEQYKAGDRTSREVSAFHWSESPNEALPAPAAGPTCGDPETDPEDRELCTKWRFSETAGAYYWSLWGEAGFDFNLPGARAEVERFTKFWLDTGVDGFMYDAAFPDPKFQQHLANLPKTYTTNDKWLTFESAAGEDQQKLDAFGLTSWFNAADDDADNNYSYVARGSDSADDLEAAFKNVDFARDHGKTSFGWSILEGSYTNELAMRPQEAALLAGAGMLYGSPGAGPFGELPAPVRASWEKVLVTINANKALLPSASRKRVQAGTDPKVYAMTRTSKDGSQSALLVYNLKATPATVTLDLAGSGIGAQTPRDLLRGRAIPAITGNAYAVPLPAYGFELLEVTR